MFVGNATMIIVLHLHNCRGLGVLASPPLCPTAVPAVVHLKKLIEPRLSTPRGGLAQSTLPQQHRQMDCGGECKPACWRHLMQHHCLFGGMGTSETSSCYLLMFNYSLFLTARTVCHVSLPHMLHSLPSCSTSLRGVPSAQQLAACHLHGHPTACVCLHLPRRHSHDNTRCQGVV